MPDAATLAVLQDLLTYTILAILLGVVVYWLFAPVLEDGLLASEGNVLVRPYGWQDGLAVMLLLAMLTSNVWSNQGGASAEPLQPGAESTGSPMDQAFSIALGSGFMLLMGMALISYLRVFRQLDPGEMFGLRVMPFQRVVLLACLAGLPIFLFVTALSYISNELLTDVWHDLTPQAPVKIFQESGHLVVQGLLAISAVVVAPLAEELLFRGYVYGVIKRYTDSYFAAAASALLFALVHLHIGTLLPLFALGLILAAAYELSGSLLMPICIHAFFNAASTALILAGYGT
ncbi:MAG: CPBP family intramembrane metalloprotease [Verrucomicrobiaceae bacterium]|nr:CPBP family intramembrane metalloprotease [Verrucomicrobiaceae bacterium]